MKSLRAGLALICLCLASGVAAQQIDITGVPTFGQAGQITGTVSGVDFSTHRVAPTIYIEGVGWWTKPSTTFSTVPINPDGTFTVNIGTAGVDELATIYSAAILPDGVTPPTLLGNATLDLGPSLLTSTYEQRYGTNLSFAGRNWGVKESGGPAGPGGNRFSSSSNDVWVDQDGLHLTIQNNGGQWTSTEVVLPEVLGYGTYMFQTTSRQDIINENAVFGAFTFDVFGDDSDVPLWPFREIDFEDSRWGNPFATTNSQAVVQPFYLPGAVERIALPDLSTDAALTRFFTWSPGRVEFFTLLGHHEPDDFPASAIIDHTVIEDDLPNNLIIPEPGRENFRLNLWLLENTVPSDGQPIEVVVNDFDFVPYTPGDFNWDGTVDGLDLLKWQRGESPDPLSQADLLDWQNNFGTNSLATANAAVVPEPSALLIALSFAVSILGRHRLPLPVRLVEQ